MRPLKIISGGQTGADKGGLLGARDCGISTGGWAPKGYRTEAGRDDELKIMLLDESASSGYLDRTERNVKDSDGTALFGNIKSAGSAQTLRFCKQYGRPTIINPGPVELHIFVEQHEIECLNIAGNRESKNPGIQERVRKIVVEAFCDSHS